MQQIEDLRQEYEDVAEQIQRNNQRIIGMTGDMGPGGALGSLSGGGSPHKSSPAARQVSVRSQMS